MFQFYSEISISIKVYNTDLHDIYTLQVESTWIDIYTRLDLIYIKTLFLICKL